MTSQLSSVLEKTQEVAVSPVTAEDKLSEKEKTPAKAPETVLSSSSSSPDSSKSKKKPAGAVSLFGGINVLDSKLTKSPLDEDNNDKSFISKDSLPPNVKDEKKEHKVKTNALSLFDDEEEDDSDWTDPVFTPSKSTAKKVCRTYSEHMNNEKQLCTFFVSLHSNVPLYVYFLSSQRIDCKQRALVCSRTRSCCSVTRSRKTMTQTSTSLLPQERLWSVD